MAKISKNLEWYDLAVFVPNDEVRFTESGKKKVVDELTSSILKLKQAFMFNGSKGLSQRFENLGKELKQLREEYIDWANNNPNLRF